MTKMDGNNKMMTEMMKGFGKGTTGPELTYFGIVGRGESVRVLMWASKMDYQNKLIGFDFWPPIKAKQEVKGLP